MNVAIPIYVEERKREGESAHYVVRPLFFTEPSRRDELLSRAMSRLAGDLRKQLDALGSKLRHDQLAEWCYAPAVEEHHLFLKLALKRSMVQCRPTVVSIEALGRRMGLIPAADNLWFEVNESQHIEERAAEVLSGFLRRLQREQEDEAALPPGLSSRAWISAIELDVQTKQAKPKDPSRFLSLSSAEIASGRQELEKVGRCLDWMYPDELERVILRDREVEELTRLLSESDRRPVLLTGPRMVGKTGIIHEYVYRQVAKRKSPYVHQHNLWLIGPQRLISGMSFVGQWENRLLAILDEAKKRDHILYFDDLLGLYHAGLTSQSDLSVAHVLRPYVERREVRVLAELTPQALRVLQERDRGLADLFHVIPVKELTVGENRRVLIESIRQLEGRHRCVFGLDPLPTATDLLNRYVRETVMPGKAVTLLRQLAIKHANTGIGRETVLDEFHATSGLSVRFLDNQQRLERKEIIEDLSQHLVGQDAAIDAMADVIGVAKARLNDPTRPLAAMLLLGPTGVGKTQAAKALATYLFGSPERLVRLDMNEFVDPDAAARLSGTFWQPEGLLTSAVRRQPFSVILLDEIEKAHPDVFDLLLGVLGEGRLTDALGRTADFSNAIIICTSNLGVREAASGFGLRHTTQQRDEVFVGAAEKFFRPEFFNRIDRLIPFRQLSRGDVQRIASKLIADVLNRDGLLQRKCVLSIEPAAMEKVVDAGFHPELGARALKRAVEKQITRAVAGTLATLPPGAPTIISVMPGRDGVVVNTHPLIDAPREAQTLPPLETEDDIEWVLERLSDAVERIEATLQELQSDRVLTQGQMDSRQYRYVIAREQAQRVRFLLGRAFDRLDAPPKPKAYVTRATPRNPRPMELRRIIAPDSDAHALWRDLAAAEQINRYFEDLVESSRTVEGPLAQQTIAALEETALLEAMSSDSDSGRVLLHMRRLGDGPAREGMLLRHRYEHVFDQHHGFVITRVELPEDETSGVAGSFLLVEMPGAVEIFAREHGTHLFLGPQGDLNPLAVRIIPLSPEDDAAKAALGQVRARTRWRESLARGEADPGDDPWPIGPIVRFHGHGNMGLDLRSGLVMKLTSVNQHAWRAFLLAQLPLPAEVRE